MGHSGRRLKSVSRKTACLLVRLSSIVRATIGAARLNDNRPKDHHRICSASQSGAALTGSGFGESGPALACAGCPRCAPGGGLFRSPWPFLSDSGFAGSRSNLRRVRTIVDRRRRRLANIRLAWVSKSRHPRRTSSSFACGLSPSMETIAVPLIGRIFACTLLRGFMTRTASLRFHLGKIFVL
jgi:hypothetical protein